MEPARDPSQAVADQPALLVELEPWPAVFLRNLRDWFSPPLQPDFQISSPPGRFWSDVFVGSGFSWRPFAQSAGFHTAALAVVWGMSHLFLHGEQTVVPAHASENVVYYSPSEYLPALDTGFRQNRVKLKGEPEHARQPILSVPSEPVNRTQTIVTPPKIKLNHEVPLPNIVAWSLPEPLVPIATTKQIRTNFNLPVLPLTVIAPLPAITRSFAQHAPALAQQVVAPAPRLDVASSARSIEVSTPAVISPPPALQAVSAHRFGDINIAPSQIVAPAPVLPVTEQRSLGGSAGASMGRVGTAVVPPPPAIAGDRGPNPSGRIIALGIHPASLVRPVAVPEGNRAGTFAASPTGRIGRRGTPDMNASGESAGTGSGQVRAGIPAGLSVGAAPGAQATSTGSDQVSGKAHTAQGPQSKNNNDSRLLADARPPDVTVAPRKPSELSGEKAGDLDRKVFGERKFYSMTLNMPNLNSAVGSWIIRFAELRQDENKGELTAPVATQKVDPAYPMDLMRHNVHGTVTLRAIIRSDGSVREVSVLRGIDDRLDQYACTALSQWHFIPATKNGSAVDLEAVVIIPFRAVRTRSGF
jgi:TonB family protein